MHHHGGKVCLLALKVNFVVDLLSILVEEFDGALDPEFGLVVRHFFALHFLDRLSCELKQLLLEVHVRPFEFTRVVCSHSVLFDSCHFEECFPVFLWVFLLEFIQEGNLCFVHLFIKMVRRVVQPCLLILVDVIMKQVQELRIISFDLDFGILLPLLLFLSLIELLFHLSLLFISHLHDSQVVEIVEVLTGNLQNAKE